MGVDDCEVLFLLFSEFTEAPILTSPLLLSYLDFSCLWQSGCLG